MAGPQIRRRREPKPEPQPLALALGGVEAAAVGGTNLAGEHGFVET